MSLFLEGGCFCGQLLAFDTINYLEAAVTILFYQVSL